MELFKANQQWSTRPDDERFENLLALYQATKQYRDTAIEKQVPFADVRTEVVSGDVQLVGKTGIPAKLTHWAFGQLAARVGAPASYLRDLPATLAVQNLNHGLAKRLTDKAANPIANLLFHHNGGMLLRAITTEDYSRIWNFEVAQSLVEIQNDGWEPAHSTMNKAEEGKRDLDLYASDHDMFVFLMSKEREIKEKNNPDGKGLFKGLIASNSEVGAGKLNVTRFVFSERCGNHIILGASEVMDISLRHVGNIRDKWAGFMTQVRNYADESVSDVEAKIAQSKTAIIAATKDEVLDAVFGKRQLNLSKKTIEAGYDAVVEQEDGAPNSKWGLVQGLTRYSQTVPYADERTAIDKAAGKILDVEF